MRSGIRFMLVLAFAFCIVNAAQAQSFPDKPIRIVVPFAPGGGADVVARVLQPRLSQVLGQTVVIENRAGAGGNIGTEVVARSPADGYTLLVATVSQAINHSLTSPPWDLVKDFDPVALLVLNQSVLAVNNTVPASSVKELISLASSKPGKITYASFGAGSSAHMNAELFKMVTGVDMLHVPYKGAAPAVNDVIAGQVDIIFCDIAAILPQIRAGRAKALAIGSNAPFAGLPGVPTFSEAGLPNYETGGFLALVAPAGTPRPAVERLNAAVADALAVPEIREKLQGMAGVPMGGSPQRLGQFLKDEVEKWARVIKTANIRAN